VIVQYQYRGRSGIVNGLDRARLAFASNTLREPTFFQGTLTRPLVFREALAALYHVVVSDFKYHPRDRLAFRAWLDQQEAKFLAGLGVKAQQARERLAELEARKAELNRLRGERLQPFYRARMEFFNHLYETEYEIEYIFDPVITVHPDEVSFEAFSRDESSYARLAARYDLFAPNHTLNCGTTNIDFSAKLHGELERMRTYRQTRFEIDPGGFSVATDQAEAVREKKIDLPESWVKGFLQVHSTMSLGLTCLTIAPVDLYNVCRYLKRRKAKTSPRALRYELTPGQRARIVIEPWEHPIELANSSVYCGAKPLSVRTWGRNRLLTIARLLPVARRVDVYLAGFGLPSIYVLDLGDLTFTLALSGWTDNDWTGGKAKFDLLARRLTVHAAELMRVYDALKETHYSTDSALAAKTGLTLERCRSALSYLCQVGRAMIDLGSNVYRHRDLFPGPLTIKEAAAAVQAPAEDETPQAKLARSIYENGGVRITSRRPVSTGFRLTGSARGDGPRVRPLLHVDHAGRIIEAECTCPYHTKHKLTKGPCEHILALRLAHMGRLEEEGDSEPPW
jgi:hypothetical protein